VLEYTPGLNHLGTYQTTTKFSVPRNRGSSVSTVIPQCPDLLMGAPSLPLLMGDMGNFPDGKVARAWCYPLTSTWYPHYEYVELYLDSPDIFMA
jgi:hypothetical protein